MYSEIIASYDYSQYLHSATRPKLLRYILLYEHNIIYYVPKVFLSLTFVFEILYGCCEKEK